MGILLTDEEIRDAVITRDSRGIVVCEPSKLDPHFNQVSKAQLKKVIVWGNEPCPHIGSARESLRTKKKCCQSCWEDLCKECE